MHTSVAVVTTDSAVKVVTTDSAVKVVTTDSAVKVVATDSAVTVLSVAIAVTLMCTSLSQQCPYHYYPGLLPHRCHCQRCNITISTIAVTTLCSLSLSERCAHQCLTAVAFFQCRVLLMYLKSFYCSKNMFCNAECHSRRKQKSFEFV